MTPTRSISLDEAIQAARAQAVADLQLLDTPAEEEFDEVVQLAADICGAPVSLLTLLDSERQFHKAHFGTDVRELPHSLGFCRYTVDHRDLYIIPDTAADDRFINNPIVHDGPRIRFYAGVPLLVSHDIAVGALCVVDTVPRTLTPSQAHALRVLGRQVSARLQLRAHATAMQSLALELRSERELFRGFLDSMPVEAYLKNDAGALLFYNRRVSERFNLQDGEWLGKTNEQLWPPAQAALLRGEEQFVLRSNQPHESYTEQALPDGGTTFWKLVQTPLRRATGELLLAGVAIDLTPELRREAALQRTQQELEEANRKLRSLALTDDLTTLWNRRAFDARLETEVHHAQHHGTPLALLMIDVDDFKQLNDTHGHSHGDDVLQQVASVLQRTVGEHHVACRFGGEEFAVILPGVQLDDAKDLCHRLSQELEQTPWAKRSVTVSVGVATRQSQCTGDQLLDQADQAMYRAKRNGKNCAVAFEAEPHPGTDNGASSGLLDTE